MIFDWYCRLSRKRYTSVRHRPTFAIDRWQEVRNRSVSVPVTLTDLEKRRATGEMFRRISVITLIPFAYNEQNRQDYTWGGACFSGSSTSQGGGAQHSQILGSLPTQLDGNDQIRRDKWGGACFRWPSTVLLVPLPIAQTHRAVS